MLKSKEELDKLAPDSTEVFKNGPIEYYTLRPAELENMCLADFVALFNIKTRSSAQQNDGEEIEGAPEEIEPVDINEDTNTLRELKLSDGTTIKERRRPKIIRYCRYNPHQDPDNYCREMIMLFHPWRNEETDILQQNCEQLLELHKRPIEENFNKYNAVPQNFDEALAMITADREHEEASVDSDEEEELIHEDGDDAANVYGFDDNVPTLDINVELDAGAYGLDTVQRYVVPDMMTENEYLHLMTSLNNEQRDYVMHVISLLKSSSTPFYHMLSGQAGVGKSCVISAIYQSAIRIFRREPGQDDDKPEVLLMAPTGKAAHNIGGMTAHAAMMLSAGKGSTTLHHLSADKQNTMREKCIKLKLLIIDEISMLTGDNFAQINTNLNDIFCTEGQDMIFGGRSMILVGDFGQLKPVGNYVFQPPTSNPAAIFVSDHLWCNFWLYELKQVMRQREDKFFAEALGRLSKGQCTEDDIKMFQGRCFTENLLPEEGQKAVRLMYANSDVDRYNCARLEFIKPSAPMALTFKALDTVIGNTTAVQRRQALHSLDLKSYQDTHGLSKSLELVVGVRYMVTVNINVSDGLFNGASGILRRIDILHGKAGNIYVEFDDTKVGSQARSDPNYIRLMTAAGAPTTWTPINRQKKKINCLERGTVQVVREQYPIVCAEAITIHKSQGSSMQSVTVDIGKGIPRQALYVALSRAVKLTALYILGKFKPPPPILPTDKCTKIMETMRSEKSLVPKFAFLRSEDGILQITSFNVQSIRKHRAAVEADPVLMSSVALLFQETWAMESESYSLKNFNESVRNKYSGRPMAQGTMLFEKPPFKFTQTNSVEYNHSGRKIEVTEGLFADKINMINIYAHPNATLDDIKNVIRAISSINGRNLILCGDFNKDLTKDTGLKNFLQQEYRLEMLLEPAPTTDSNTAIDGVFGHLLDFDVRCFIYESFFSFHKPIVFRLSPKLI